MYNSLRVALLERVHDREPFVRVQAVVALAKICSSEDLEELGEGGQATTEVLEDLFSHDPSACVSLTCTLLLF
jgi:condensin complex subunit 3